MYKIGQCRPLACVQGIGCLQSCQKFGCCYVPQQQHSCCSQRYAALGQCPDQLGQLLSGPLHCSPARPRVGYRCVTPVRQTQRLQPLHKRYQRLTLKHHQTPSYFRHQPLMSAVHYNAGYHHNPPRSLSQRTRLQSQVRGHTRANMETSSADRSARGRQRPVQARKPGRSARVLLIVSVGATEHRRADIVPQGSC